MNKKDYFNYAKLLCQKMGVKIEDVSSESRKQHLVRARSVISFCMLASFPCINKRVTCEILNRHASTLNHHWRLVLSNDELLDFCNRNILETDFLYYTNPNHPMGNVIAIYD